MTVTVRVVLTVAVTALFSVSVTGFLAQRAASERVPRAFGMAMGHGPSAPMAGPGGAAARQLLDELRSVTMRAGGIALLVAVTAGGALALRTSRPLIRLAEVTQRYGGGDRSARASVEGRDEVAALARVFNETADRLQAEHDRRQRLATDIAHELGTPLTVLRGELESIQDGLMAPDANTVTGLLEQVELLSRLVHDLRLLTSAEAGELGLELTSVALDVLAERAARAFVGRAEHAAVRLRVAVAPVVVVGDSGRLLQVINALLDNALRHAPGGEVCVAVRRVGDEAQLEVSDDGPGVGPEHLAHLFERFYRADAARGRATGGSGLGLAIVAAIARLHSGRAEAFNRAAGGISVRVTLPIAGHAVPAGATGGRRAPHPG